MRIGLANASTLVSDSDAQKIAVAVDAQLNEDVAPGWHRAGMACIYVPGGAKAQSDPDVLLLTLADTVDDPDALGYHDERPDGTIYGLIAVKPILDAGGGVIVPGKSGDSVSAVVSHEAIEAKIDPNANLWVDGPVMFGGKIWASTALEACDAVQARGYFKNGVWVSNFILPAWLDPHNRGGSHYDFLGALTAPLSVDKGGYLIVRDAPGDASQVFGAEGNGCSWRSGARRHRRMGCTDPLGEVLR